MTPPLAELLPLELPEVELPDVLAEFPDELADPLDSEEPDTDPPEASPPEKPAALAALTVLGSLSYNIPLEEIRSCGQ
jgi:hypothetical protein